MQEKFRAIGWSRIGQQIFLSSYPRLGLWVVVGVTHLRPYRDDAYLEKACSRPPASGGWVGQTGKLYGVNNVESPCL